ncbi:MAG: polysaccharide deacetylase family protein [Oscillospiraceae bacterium]|nr:polysaccharide deacetylase family protein [Oscillospiraceae bacterium]
MICAVFLLFAAVPRARAASGGAVELPVIMYHHLHKSASRWGDFIVSPEVFEGDLRYLRERGYHAVSLRELDAYLTGAGGLPEKPILITFDDGQESFLEYAVPLLETYGMCAVLAVVGAYADRDTGTEHNVAYSYLSWDQLAELARNPRVELQNHSYDMHDFSPRHGSRINRGETRTHYADAFGGDASKNDRLLVERAGVVPLGYACPFGYYTEDTREVLRDIGYRFVFTCENRVNRLERGAEGTVRLDRFNRSARVDRGAFFAKIMPKP